MSYQDYLSGDQFPKNYRSAYKRAQEIGRNLPPVHSDTGQMGLVKDPSETRAVVRHLSRSTMPGEHLQGMAGIRTSSSEVPVNTAMYDADTKLLHTGFAIAGNISENRHRESQADTQHALVHETGHHNETMIQRFGGRGKDEGLAENYAEHYRSPQYSAHYQPSTYDASYKGDRSREAVEYRKTRKAKELPGGHGKRF